jgi:hypothetical protein
VASRQTTLTTALQRFINDGIAARDRLGGDVAADMHVRPGVDEFAAILMELPAAKSVDSVALDAAVASRYLVRKPRQGGEGRAAGRAMTARALVETGVAGLLLSGERVDAAVLAAELSGYLAGPAVSVWDYAIIDADIWLSGAVPLIEGWELLTPSKQELSQLVGVPSAARYVGRQRSFNLDLYGGLAMLRRKAPGGKPVGGLLISFDFRPPAHALWQPLLALSLYQNPVVHLWARYTVEPGRRVDVRFDHVYTEPWTPDGVIETEVVRKGDYRIGTNSEEELRGFLAHFVPMLEAAMAQPARPTKASRELAARLRRIAEHFLTASEEAHGEGEVLSEDNADAVLHYVIALEAVLAGGESDKTELTRKVVQRAAILAGVDDQDRQAIAATVRAAYASRSAYAHGSEPDEIDLPALRRVVRDCMLARLILGDPSLDGESLAQLADAALLDHSLLADRVRGPILEFWAAVHAPGEATQR